MTDGDALLLAIARNPDEDTPRLAYADWLDENNDPLRARLIRFQCERAQLPTDDPRAAELRKREQVLLNYHRAEWSGPFGRLTNRQPLSFVRGFWDPSALPFAPLAGDERTLLEVAASPFALWLDKLRCTFGLSDFGAKALASSPYLCRLQELQIYPLTPEALEFVVTGPHLSELVELSLVSSRLGNTEAQTIAGRTTLPALARLDLSRNEIGNEGVRALAASDRLSRLTRLDLRHNPVGGDGLAELIASRGLLGLKHLGLSDTPCGPEHQTSYDQGVAVDWFFDTALVSQLESLFGNRLQIF